jgi:hypothetical protein
MNRDPRIRQTLNRISSTLETANLNTQASLWSIQESYLSPCLNSISECLESACYPCVGARRERARARQRRNIAARGRPEFIFDFYNDEWNSESEDNERTGLLRGWGADELDRLLAGSSDTQPKRKTAMSYGTKGTGRRRRSTLTKKGEDPTLLPGSSMFGFLERLPWKIGGRGVRYKPSAADLQENPGRRGKGEQFGYGTVQDGEASALLDESSDDASDIENGNAAASEAKPQKQRHQRNRSDTTASESTQTSLSSRGDLFPSEDEAADAIPLDDSFALDLTRRSMDGENEDDADTIHSIEGKNDGTKSTKTSRSKRSNSKSTARSNRKRRQRSDRDRRQSGAGTPQSKKSKTSKGSNGVLKREPSTPSTKSVSNTDLPESEQDTSLISNISGFSYQIETPKSPQDTLSSVLAQQTAQELPSLEDLAIEEEQVRKEEEEDIKRKRQEAQALARDRGLGIESPAISPIEPGLGPDPRDMIRDMRTSHEKNQEQQHRDET